MCKCIFSLITEYNKTKGFVTIDVTIAFSGLPVMKDLGIAIKCSMCGDLGDQTCLQDPSCKAFDFSNRTYQNTKH